MKQLTPYLRTWALVAICATLLVVAMGVGRPRTSRVAVMDGARQQQFLFSATEIVLLPGGNTATDSDIARLDTTTGAIYRFRGNVDNPSVTNTWQLRVPPVKLETSGFLEIQNIAIEEKRPATFLVDIVYGTTWILRERARSNAAWELVDIYRAAG